MMVAAAGEQLLIGSCFGCGVAIVVAGIDLPRCRDHAIEGIAWDCRCSSCDLEIV